jgi:hypothetical protein
MVDQGGLVLLESADDALESRCDVGEVGDTTADDQDLAIRVRFATSDQVNCEGMRWERRYSRKLLTDRLRIFVSLTFCRSARVLSVVGEFMSKAVGRNGVGVDDRGTTTSNHGPYAAFGVENGELKRCTSRTIKLLDVRFLLCEVTTERRRPHLK